VASSIEEGLQRHAKLRRQFLFAQRSQQGYRALVRAELRDAAGALQEMLVQLTLDGWRKLVFEVVRQQADDIAALAGVVSHAISKR
jgi:hypothetical protein